MSVDLRVHPCYCMLASVGEEESVFLWFQILVFSLCYEVDDAVNKLAVLVLGGFRADEACILLDAPYGP